MDSGDVEQSLLPKLSDSDKRKSLQRRKSNRHGSFSHSVENNNQPQNYDVISHQRIAVSQVSFRKVFVLLATYLGGGTFCFFLVRDQITGKKTNGIVDAIYFCVVTMTTVGYGDLVPNSIVAKLLACAYVFTGMTLGGMILSKAADYIVEKQEILLVKAMYMRKKISSSEILQESEAHKLKYKFIMTGILLWTLVFVGTLFLTVVEKLEFIDAFYCVCSTITTLGYGDESFSTTAGRVFAVIWIMSSTICLAQFFLYLAELHTERRQESLVNWVLSRSLTYSDLEEADLDHDKVVSAAEFVIYKLKEMGKINQEDVSPILETFKKLDIDQSGNHNSCRALDKVVLRHNLESLHLLLHHELRFQLGNHLQRRPLPPRVRLWRRREAKRKLEYLETEELHIQTMTEPLKLLLQQLFGLCVGEPLFECPWRRRRKRRNRERENREEFAISDDDSYESLLF
ncbi:unnamed protein product [Citrullus colocynthis]|uniref:Potassium channel domain-containing protein n=1 Tax=Citrullus colocynthis TaxID=252529 RepID=A0ABP0XYH9_9ROSI